jgi:hypothetical protein
MFAKFIDVTPVANATITLHFRKFRIAHGFLTPLQFEVGTLFQNTVMEVWDLLHLYS